MFHNKFGRINSVIGRTTKGHATARLVQCMGESGAVLHESVSTHLFIKAAIDRPIAQ
jgi:hypothetical protein